jgi:BlaI family transcriptional regulator, penicillinase repressor
MIKPTEGELEILRVLWREGQATVRQVNEALNHELDRAIGYTTTLKLMQIMHEKKLLERHKEGKTHIYRALISEKATRGQLLDRLMNTAFRGSAAQLVMQALGEHRTSKEELDEIRQFLDQIDSEETDQDPQA